MRFLKNKDNISLSVFYSTAFILLCLFYFFNSEAGCIVFQIVENNDLLRMLFFPAYLAFQSPDVFSSGKGEKQNDENNLKEASNYFQSYIDFFEKYPSAVEFYDKEGYLVWKNPVAKNKWKSSIDYQKGKFRIWELDAKPKKKFYSLVEKAFNGKPQVYNGPDYHYTRENFQNKKQSNVQVYISPFFEFEEKITGIILIFIKVESGDISNYIEENEQLQAKSFLSKMSHELRTPLNWILGFSDLIDQQQDIKKIKAYNASINKGGKVLLSMIEKLIELSGIVKNEVTIEKREFSLTNTLNETIRILKNEVKVLKSDISIQIQTSFNHKEDNIHMISDERKLKQVLMYLTHNSLKFTKTGYIEIGCRELPEDIFLFHVKDTGIGISKDIQYFIFDILRKGCETTPSLTEGQGLGLTLAKNYVNLMGGNIWVESEKGKGATFFFTIKNYTWKIKKQTTNDNVLKDPDRVERKSIMASLTKKVAQKLKINYLFK